MPDYRRFRVPGGAYFFTVNLLERRLDLLARHIDLLCEAVQATRRVRPFHIDAWVVLPDHLHCIWTLPPDDANFGIRWAMIKRTITKQCGPDLRREDWMNDLKRQHKESTLWQRWF